MAYQFHEEAIRTDQNWTCFNARSAYIFKRRLGKKDQANVMQVNAFSNDKIFGQSEMGRLVE